jgi:alpha-1,2-mannosyltransferase
LILLSVALLVTELASIATNPYISISDYSLYIGGAQRFLDDPTTLYLDRSKVTLSGYLYPPPSALLFVPFSWLSLTTGFYVFSVAAVVVFFVLSLVLWFTNCEQHGLRISLTKKLVIGAICASLGPTYHNLLFGQINFVVLAACLGFLVLADRGRPKLAGLMLATGIWLKLYPLLLCVVAMRDRRSLLAVLWTIVFLLLMALVLLPLVPARVYAIYFGDFLPDISRYLILTQRISL